MIDPDLRERAALGDRAALDAVLAAASPSIRRFTARMCRTPAEADDAAQDTLLAVSQHLGEFEGRSAFSTWLFTLARTACNRRQRTLKGAPPVMRVLRPLSAGRTNMSCGVMMMSYDEEC